MFVPKRLVIFVVLFFLLIFQRQVIAEESNLPQVVIGPDKYLFFSIKRLFEKAVILTKFSDESKADYLNDLTLSRASELKFVVENKLLGQVEKASQRLAYQVGILSDYLVAHPASTGKEQDTISMLIGLKGLLGYLRDQYSANSSYWMLVQQDIDSININVMKLQ